MKEDAKNTLNWQEIGQRFRALREGNKLTQAQIGEVSKQMRSAVSRLELGLQPASINYALFLRNEFGASFDWLYDGEDIKVKNSDRA
ncbi:helix-turn-helix transcriptional regulator, partial [Candidatus Liberibacter africanus]